MTATPPHFVGRNVGLALTPIVRRAESAGTRGGGVLGDMSTAVAARPAGGRRTAGLTLAALGVVFGDIGTSPLYTVQTCFSDFTGLSPTRENVLGMLSLITWALLIVVT